MEDFNRKIFDRYNPASDVVRCPYGRSSVRKALDLYAQAAVNLYGIISCKELAEIFNAQNEEQITAEEMYVLLLPLLRKEFRYGFYKDHIVHPIFFESVESIEDWVGTQGDKPRYIPEKEEFIRFSDEDNITNTLYFDLQDWFYRKMGMNFNTIFAAREIRTNLRYTGELKRIEEIMESHDLIFPDEDTAFEFYELYIEAANNERLWSNKGYTPNELAKILKKQDKHHDPTPRVQEQKKIGRNDSCPCGSGKKYKKCCGLLKEKGTDHLSNEEAKEFYDTFYHLLAFVNEKETVIRKKMTAETFYRFNSPDHAKISDALWERPELIDEYIKENHLPPDTIGILKSWQQYSLKGSFIVFEYRPEYAVLLGIPGEGDKAEDRVFGVRGLTKSISDVLRHEMPHQVETVLLPFKGKIVYHTFMASMDIRFGPGLRSMFQKTLDKVGKQGIITDLEKARW